MYLPILLHLFRCINGGDGLTGATTGATTGETIGATTGAATGAVTGAETGAVIGAETGGVSAITCVSMDSIQAQTTTLLIDFIVFSVLFKLIQ